MALPTPAKTCDSPVTVLTGLVTAQYEAVAVIVLVREEVDVLVLVAVRVLVREEVDVLVLVAVIVLVREEVAEPVLVEAPATSSRTARRTTIRILKKFGIKDFHFLSSGAPRLFIYHERHQRVSSPSLSLDISPQILNMLQSVLLSSLMLAAGAQSNSPTLSSTWCKPGDPCWPSKAQWARFNVSVSGRLLAVAPPMKPCAALGLDSPTCAAIQESMYDPVWRTSHPGASFVPEWETNIVTGAGCINTSAFPKCEQVL